MIKRVQAPPAAPPAGRRLRPRRAYLTLSLVLLTLMFSAVSARQGVIPALSGKRELPIYSVMREDKVIAISFDAAWGGDKTEAILDILDQYEVKTTFFLVDIWARRFPELVKEIASRGHEIGNHSTKHPHMSKLSEAQIIEELKVMSDNAQLLTGTRPTLFRPPYGDYNDRVISVSRAQGYEAVQWSVDSLDWKNRGKDEIVRRATRVSPGDIVLFHNDSQYIVEALPDVLESYKTNGYSVVPVSDILLQGATTVDIQGRQQPLSTTIPEV